jgi:hypothetical protein
VREVRSDDGLVILIEFRQRRMKAGTADFERLNAVGSTVELADLDWLE